MIKVEDKEGELSFVNGPDKAPVESPDLATVLRELLALQRDLDAAKPEEVLPIVQRSLVRLVLRSVATLGVETQELAGAIEEVRAEGPPPIDGHVLVSVDVIELALEPLTAVVQLLVSTVQNHPKDTPEQQQLVQGYAAMAEGIGSFTSGLSFQLQAYKRAAEAAADAANEEGDDDDDEDGDDE